ncbi:MAG: hypothetical protein IJ099_03095 [Alphaproteobacteria bacterium]|nr:hypothetical protein [Alphaproteobacteria bacterium]
MGKKVWAFVCRKNVRLYGCYALFGACALLMSLLMTVNVLVIIAGIITVYKFGCITQNDWWRFGPFVWALLIATFWCFLMYFWRSARTRAHRIANMSVEEFADELMRVVFTAVLVLFLVIFCAGIYQLGRWIF